MEVNDMLEYRNKIIDAFKNFCLNIFKNDAAHNYVLKDVNLFIEEIKLMAEKINLSLFKEFFELSSPAKYAKELINTKNQDENKKRIEEIKYRISDLEDIIKKNE